MKALSDNARERAVLAVSLAVGSCPDADRREKAIRGMEALLGHVGALEAMLDQADDEDTFGTEGWRHRAGIDG